MASKKSEGPFLVVDGSYYAVTTITKLPDLKSVSARVYKTRAELDEFIKNMKASENTYFVFEGIEKISFEHDVVVVDINAE